MSFARYPAYKDSGVDWLGEVPAHWEVVRLNTTATCNDEVLLESTAEDYEIEYVEISGVQAGQGITETATLPFGNAPSRARRVVRDGDVLISTVRTYLRAIAQVKSPPENMIASTGFAVLRPRRIDSRFLGYACHAEGFVSEVIARSVGVSYPAINASELARLPIPLPTAPEQTAIATFLDRETAKIDALVAEQERLIALLKEKRQAVISHAVTKGLDPSVPMMDSGVEWLGKVPAHWLIRPIKHVGRLKGGAGFPHSEQGVEGEELCFYKVGSLGQSSSTGYLNESENTISRETASALGAFIFPKETLVFAKVGAALFLARVRALPADACLDNNMMGLVVDETKHAPAFVRYAMTLVRFDLIANPGAVPSLNEGQIGNFALAFPPSKAEQEAIAAFLDRATGQLEDLFAQAETVISTLRERRTALISAAVTGQIDVRGAPEQAP